MNDHSYTSRRSYCFITVILNLKFVRKYRYISYVKELKYFEDGWLELIQLIIVHLCFVKDMMREDSGLTKRLVTF